LIAFLCDRCSRLKFRGLADSPLDAHFADADFACGAHYRRPGIVKQGDSVFATLACIFRTILPGIDT